MESVVMIGCGLIKHTLLFCGCREYTLSLALELLFLCSVPPGLTSPELKESSGADNFFSRLCEIKG